MIYIDTSAIVKLYIKETDSKDVSRWIRNNNEPIPLTGLTELELKNALKLKESRKEIHIDNFHKIWRRLEQHEERGVYYRPSVDWPEVFGLALDLTNNHTSSIGSRSLDILHVAVALFLKVDRILTFDERQSQLAAAAGITVINLG